MTDKELRHLNRSELLQMLITQGEENRRLKEQLEEANQKLNDRQLVMENAGSIETVAPCEKTKDMSSEEYWQQVKERAQKLLSEPFSL